jgi:DNA-binding CsgD family transcriptional regulator
MADVMEAPPSRKQLKELLLDRLRREHPAASLNCMAHMILCIEEPASVAAIASEFLASSVGACRADAGTASPGDRAYVPLAVHYNARTDPPRCDDSRYDNTALVFRTTWRRSGPVACDRVRDDPLLADCRTDFTEIGSKSIVFNRLTFRRKPVGMVCIDVADAERRWSAGDLAAVNAFCETFLGPALAISKRWWGRDEAALSRRPSPAELAAIRCIAEGMSVDLAARTLGKSVRTIENQLRQARAATGAATRTELIRRCELWL